MVPLVQFLGWEDPLEQNQKYPHSRILAWGIPWTEEPGGLQPWGRKDSDTAERLTLSLSLRQRVLPVALLWF